MPDTSSVAAAEAAWLDAMTRPEMEGVRHLLHPEFRAVHGPVGFIHGADDYLRYARGMGAITGNEVSDVSVRHFQGTAIVTCLQELHVAFIPDLAPFVFQAVITRVWAQTGDGWRLVHIQSARRQLPQ